MKQAARSGLTLLVLALLVVLGALWGWSAMTQPLPGEPEPAKCVIQTVAEGDRVVPGQVTVSVFNASNTDGLAGRTLAEFSNAGFAEGDTGNAPRDARVVRAVIWAPRAASPDVRLVRSRLGPTTRVVPRPDPPGVGVTVVVGDAFTKLVKGPRSVRATQESEICSPPAS
jgi:hypothetical protein